MGVEIHESVLASTVNMADIKAQGVVSDLSEPGTTPKPPVADNFMYDFKYNHTLPTSDALGIEVPTDCNVQKEAEAIVARLSKTMGAGDARAFTDMFLEYGRFSPFLFVDDL